MFTCQSTAATLPRESPISRPDLCSNMIRFVLLFVLAIPCVIGCRQPSAGTTGGLPVIDFNRLGQNATFENSNQVASNSWFGGNRPTKIQTQTPEEYQEYAGLAQEIQTLNQRLGAFDSDNNQLYSEIAGLKQKLQVANDYNSQIRQQLADSSVQFQQLQSEKQNLQQQLAQASQLMVEQSNSRFASTSGGDPSQLIGGATVRSNNSLLQKLDSIRIPGGEARMDGDVIRIEFPSDILFAAGTYEIRPDQATTFQNIVTTIQQNFPRQIIGVEAHWDGTQLNPPTTTHHQLTATQALAVFNRLVQSGLPADQLFTMAMGSNRPRHAGATQAGISPNRRIEIVIYPESFNGK